MGSAFTGGMNQFSVSGHTQKTESMHLVQPKGPTDAAPFFFFFIWTSPLTPPSYTHTHTHTHRLAQAQARTLIASGLSSSLASSAPLGAPSALMEQRRQASLHPYTPSPPHIPLFTPTLDKFNLEVQRADKTRRQHKGQRGREVIWYLLLLILHPPHPTPSPPTHTCTHIHIHLLLCFFFSTLHPETKTSFFPLSAIFFSLIRGMTEGKERRMSNTMLQISDTLPVELCIYDEW